MNHSLELPYRTSKPRESGLTILLDNGLPLRLFKDYIESFNDYIDFVKFGWGTSIVSKNIKEKILFLKSQEIKYFFGGTLFEKYYSQNKVDEYIVFCKKLQCDYIEVSNGTIDISNEVKSEFILELSKEFHVFSEVGYKDANRSNSLTVTNWIDYIEQDLKAGAYKVITESRESGKSGICQTDGAVKEDIVDSILVSDFSIHDIVFEAPNKELQTYFIEKIGSNVNLANIPFDQIVSLETSRLGLRSDTFYL